MDEAYQLCADLYGECRCAAAKRPACDAMVAMADDGEDADDERDRMEAERAAAEFEQC